MESVHARFGGGRLETCRKATRWPSTLQMIGVMPDTRGRDAGEGRQNPTGAVEAAAAQYRWRFLPGEPDAVKAARPGVRREAL
jgi:hypothetical protein